MTQPINEKPVVTIDQLVQAIANLCKLCVFFDQRMDLLVHLATAQQRWIETLMFDPNTKLTPESLDMVRKIEHDLSTLCEQIASAPRG